MLSESMERFMEYGAAWLWLVCLATWRALPLLVLALGIGLTLRRRLSPALHALLWTVVVVRLLLPFSLGSPMSFQGTIDAWYVAATESPVEPASRQSSSQPAYATADSAPWMLSEVPQPTVTSEAIAWEDVLAIALLALVVLVTIGCLLRSIVAHLRFAYRLRGCRELCDQALIDLLLRECDALRVGRRPKIREVPSLSTPAVFGLLRHTICLPANFMETLTEQELRWVLRHELAHIRRRDTSVMALAAVAQAIHWFNPLVWLTISKLRAAIESAADRLALGQPTSADASSYGKLLLRLAEHGAVTPRSPALGLLPFASARHLKKRVQLLMQSAQPRRKFAGRLAAIVVLAIACMGLTDAAETVEATPEIYLPPHNPTVTFQSDMQYEPWQNEDDSEPVITKNYDLTALLQAIPQPLAESIPDTKSRLMTWIPSLPMKEEQFQVDGQTLIAELTAPRHEALARILDKWQDGLPQQVVIESRFIQTSVKLAGEIDWVGKRVEGVRVKGPGAAIAARISEVELWALMQAISAEPEANIKFGPKVTVFDGQTAVIADQAQRPFVTNIAPHVDGQLEPVISVLDEGLRLIFTPNVTGNEGVHLAFGFRASKIGDISYANLPLRSSRQTAPHVTVQVPSVVATEVESSVDLAAGESIIIAIPQVFTLEPGRGAERTTLVTLTPRILNAAD